MTGRQLFLVMWTRAMHIPWLLQAWNWKRLKYSVNQQKRLDIPQKATTRKGGQNLYTGLICLLPAEVRPLYLLPHPTVQTRDKGKFQLMDFVTIFPVEYRTLSTMIYGKIWWRAIPLLRWNKVSNGTNHLIPLLVLLYVLNIKPLRGHNKKDIYTWEKENMFCLRLSSNNDSLNYLETWNTEESVNNNLKEAEPVKGPPQTAVYHYSFSASACQEKYFRENVPAAIIH